MKRLHFFVAVLSLVSFCFAEKVSNATVLHQFENNNHTQYTKVSLNTPVNNNITVLSQPVSKLLNVPLINQNPELRYGCEVTSLAMVLQFAGVKVSKLELYKKVKKDPDPIKRAANGDIVYWGDPHQGFVGDMTGKRAGYAVFDKPISQLVNDYLPGRSVNLTNQPFDKVLQHVSKGYPVVIWTTGDYRLPDRWESWRHGTQTIKTPLDLHAVVLVGFDQQNVYLNDPLSNRKNVKVNKQRFIKSWEALKSRAVSYQ
ncbi:C39 family peptidase [Pseudoneobacillus sp. C159]